MKKLLGRSTSTTIVQVHDESGSIDRDVKIYLDASYKGRGEVIHSDIKIIGSTTAVTLRKEGCRTMQYSFSRSEKLLVEPLILIGGLFFWFPFS